MTPNEFVQKWSGVTLKERSSSQEHFIDLCRLLDEPTPVEADPTGKWFCFEKGAAKTSGADGWADVWRKGRFAWEYKGPGKNLKAAFAQLQQYAPALDYPPLLIVSDAQTIEIHTAFTGLVHETHTLQLEDLLDHAKRRLLKWAFTDPEKLKPATTKASLTEEAAGRFAALAQSLRDRGHPADAVAHFSLISRARLFVPYQKNGARKLSIAHTRRKTTIIPPTQPSKNPAPWSIDPHSLYQLSRRKIRSRVDEAK